jgi:hypothetical protein
MGRGTVNKTKKSEAIDLLMQRCDAPHGFPPADLADLRLGFERMTVGQLRILVYFFLRRKRRQATGAV